MTTLLLGFLFGLLTARIKARQYTPQQLVKGSRRANEMLSEVDFVYLMIDGLLVRSYSSTKSTTFRFKINRECEWVLTYNPNERRTMECKIGGNTVYVAGRGRNHPPSFKTTFAIYQSMPKLIKQMTKTFPWLREGLNGFLEAAEY